MNIRIERVLSRDEQAAEWCVRLADERLEPCDQLLFDEWIGDAGNRAAFELAIRVWRGVDVAARQPEVIRLRTEALEDYSRANRRRWIRRIPAMWRWSSLAAGVAAMAMFAMFLGLRDDGKLLQTGIGERRVVILPEGSQVSLDAATQVRVRFSDSRRQLELLSGRAKFDVAKDPLRPFSVAVGKKVVVATGTSFSVERMKSQLRVVLFEGRVEVLQPAVPRMQDAGHSHSSIQPVVLTPGRELLASIDEAVAPTVTATDTSRSLSWEGGQLVFIEEPLSSAVERVNRYSQRKLVIEGTRTADLRLNGVFNAGDNAAFIEAVRTLLPVDTLEFQDHIAIRLRNSN